MADSQTGQEKTEQATPKRRQDSRKKGQIPRSKELSTMLLTVTGAGGLIVFSNGLSSGMMDVFHKSLQVTREQSFDKTLLLSDLLSNLWAGISLILPFLMLMMIAALVAPLALGGWVFNTSSLAFKWEKINPAKGLKRIFSVKGLVELAKAMIKFLVIAVLSTALLYWFMPEILALATEPLQQAIVHGARLFLWLFLMMASGLILIAAVDIPYQLWDNSRKLRMTRQEVRDEMKETDGNPEVRQRIRGLQREMAQRRMMEEVPNADVIVVNPAHYSVALRYEQNKPGAPTVIAKGTDQIALKIREIAQHHSVTVFEAPPLARAVYYSTKLKQEIPKGLYVAVAQVLAYVYQLKAAHQHGGVEPEPPTNLSVSDEYEEMGRRNEKEKDH